MFAASAEFYDAVYSFKDYKKEALDIHAFIKKRNPDAKTVLDVACGTGKHIEYLNSFYETDGLDLNEKFVEIARERNPSSTIWCRDMTEINSETT